MTEEDVPSTGPRAMRLRYTGRCRGCNTEIPRGTRAVYDPRSRTVTCLGCGGVQDPAAEPPSPVPATRGDQATNAGRKAEPALADISPCVAGASARREHERRVAARQERVRQRHPRLGGLILALSDDPQTTRAWATGAVGEERLGRRLDGLVGPSVQVLHDRGIPRSRANLDHLVVCPGGVLVVDAKRYRGRPRHVVQGGLLTPRTEKLVVGGRDRTRLVDAVLQQADLVRDALDDETVEVRSVLCFVEADWPVIGGDFVMRGVRVTWPRKLATMIGRAGPLDEERVTALHHHLASAFPPA